MRRRWALSLKTLYTENAIAPPIAAAFTRLRKLDADFAILAFDSGVFRRFIDALKPRRKRPAAEAALAGGIALVAENERWKLSALLLISEGQNLRDTATRVNGSALDRMERTSAIETARVAIMNSANLTKKIDIVKNGRNYPSLSCNQHSTPLPSTSAVPLQSARFK